MRRRTWQKITKPGGWLLMATIGQMWGIGATWFGRYNGMDIFFGPLTITIQPPAPDWAKGEIKSASNDDSMTTVS